MTVKIYKYSNTLDEISSMELFVSNAQSLLVSQLMDGVYSYDATLPFTISTASGQIPFLEEEEIMVVLREKIDLSAHGKDDIAIKNMNIDTTQSPKPYRPLATPKGFTELRGSNG
jgi:hypothetical protein